MNFEKSNSFTKSKGEKKVQVCLIGRCAFFDEKDRTVRTFKMVNSLKAKDEVTSTDWIICTPETALANFLPVELDDTNVNREVFEASLARLNANGIFIPDLDHLELGLLNRKPQVLDALPLNVFNQENFGSVNYFVKLRPHVVSHEYYDSALVSFNNEQSLVEPDVLRQSYQEDFTFLEIAADDAIVKVHPSKFSDEETIAKQQGVLKALKESGVTNLVRLVYIEYNSNMGIVSNSPRLHSLVSIDYAIKHPQNFYLTLEDALISKTHLIEDLDFLTFRKLFDALEIACKHLNELGVTILDHECDYFADGTGTFLADRESPLPSCIRRFLCVRPKNPCVLANDNDDSLDFVVNRYAKLTSSQKDLQKEVEVFAVPPNSDTVIEITVGDEHYHIHHDSDILYAIEDYCNAYLQHVDKTVILEVNHLKVAFSTLTSPKDAFAVFRASFFEEAFKEFVK